MPVHDWRRVDPVVFHDFHNVWIGMLRNALNEGGLPSGYYAMSEQQKTLAIRHVSDHRLIAVVEIVSPANKDRHDHVREFLDKIEDLLAHGIHILLIDLFPPGSHDPLGLHAALWDRLGDTPEPPPADEPLTLASYVAGAPVEAYLEHLAVGQSLADMPLFLDPGVYVCAPLEETYQATWRGTPEPWRAVLQAKCES